MVQNTFITFQIKKDVIKNYQIGRTIPHCGFQLELVSHKSPQSLTVDFLPVRANYQP